MGVGDWIALAVLLLLAGGSAAGVYAVLNNKISHNTAKLHEKCEAIQRDYVRRDDLRDDIQRLERGQESLGNKMDGMVNAMVPAMARMTEAAVSLRDKN